MIDQKKDSRSISNDTTRNPLKQQKFKNNSFALPCLYKIGEIKTYKHSHRGPLTNREVKA